MKGLGVGLLVGRFLIENGKLFKYPNGVRFSPKW